MNVSASGGQCEPNSARDIHWFCRRSLREIKYHMRRKETPDVLFEYMGAQKTKYRAVMLYTRCTVPSQDKKSTAWISIGTVMCRTKRTWGDLAAVRLEIDAWVRPLSRNPTSPVDLSIHRKLLRREAARGAILTNVVTSLHTMDGQCVFFLSERKLQRHSSKFILQALPRECEIPGTS